MSEEDCSVAENFLIPEVHHLSIQNAWYQQDGAISHTTRISMEVL